MASPRTLLHVFPTFNVGGLQSRFAQLANHFGDRYRHLIVSMDGGTGTMERLRPGLDAKLLSVEFQKGKMLHNARRFRRVCKSRSNNPSLKRPIGLAAPEQNCGS